MKGLAISVLVLGFIVLAGAGAVLFMIFSPSVTILPTTVLTAGVEGILLLALCNIGLAVVVISKSPRRKPAESAPTVGAPTGPVEPSL